jgi:hypothetical protein
MVPGRAKNVGPGQVQHLPRGVTAAPGTDDAIRSGQADLSFTVHGYTPGRFVATQMAEFPFLGNSAEAVSVAFQRAYAKHPAFAAEHPGIKVLAVFTHAGQRLNTKRPIAKADDLGLKPASAAAWSTRSQESAAANVKPAPRADSRHRGDGRHPFPAESVESFKIDKVISTRPFRAACKHQLRLHDEPGQGRLPKTRRPSTNSSEFAARCRQGWDKVDRRDPGLHAGQRRSSRADAASSMR